MKILPVIFLFLPLALHAQLKVSFEEGDLNQWQQFPADHWELSTVIPLKGQYSLHHSFDNSIQGSDRISLLHEPLYLDSLITTWKFCILHACPPSSENNWAVYFVADRTASFMNPDSNINAYAVGVNLEGYDDILKLYSIKNGCYRTVINTGFNWQAGTSVLHGTCIEITRSPGGQWSLAIDTTGTGVDLKWLGNGLDMDIRVSNYIGFTYNYTSINDRKLWFDEFLINGFFKEDTLCPDIKKVSVVSPNCIEIQFTETVNTGKMSLAGFSVNNEIGNPVTLNLLSPASIILTFIGTFTSTLNYEVTVAETEDIYGNAIRNLKNNFFCYFAKPYDIVMNEIMADPEPAMNLPLVEYIELMNKTGYEIEANGWHLTVGENSIALPPFRMEEQTYLLICEAFDSLLLQPYGTVLPVKGLPLLNNEGETLTLKDSKGDIIHSVSYSIRWFSNSQKSEGGWSLEMKDPENPCGGYGNWDGSENYLGGTPGVGNSLICHNPDNIRPYLYRAATTSDSGLLITFNESMKHAGITDPFKYAVNYDIFHPSSTEPISPDYSAINLTFQSRFEPLRVYELMVKDEISDCAGNLLENSYIDFGLASLPDSFDLAINEILFDARDDEEFIEIINRSDKIIELSSLKIVLMEEFTGTFIKTLFEIPGYFQLLPGQYVVITRNAAVLQDHYNCINPAAIIEATGMAALPDKEGVIALLDKKYRVIDKFIYRSVYHFELITDPEGISLERLHCDYPTNDPENWHSAAEVAGFATPGYENSQSFSMDGSAQVSVWTAPDVFTPDNDGNDDYLTIIYQFNKPGLIATVLIFDNRGNLVKQLANNVMLGTDGFFTWDGTNTEGAMEKAGLYLVYTEVFSEQGSLSKFKNTCVLAKELK
jgi:hypothetical protein